MRGMTQPILNPVNFKSLLPLLPAEQKFRDCLARGERCRLGESLPQNGDDSSIIRAEVVRFFAFGGDVNHPVRGGSIRLRGAYIKGRLPLQFVRMPYGLFFPWCHFDSEVDIVGAECIALDLSKCRLARGLDGGALKVSGDVLMRNIVAEGEVRLVGAEIGGDLNCANGKFKNPKECALNAHRIKVGGDVLLRRGFSAEGEVCLSNARIGGRLDCMGGSFENPGDFGERGQKIYALNAEQMRTTGHVYLNRHKITPRGMDVPFSARGRVRFANADIGGNFNCKGGQFLHLGKRSALAAGGLKSRGAVFLSDGFTAKGEVALHVARIGNFVCKECGPTSKGVINLASTKAVAVDDDKESWESFEFLLDDFTYDTFYGDSPRDAKARLKWLAKRPAERRLKNGEEVEVPFSPLPYEQAAKVLFGMGRPVDAWDILREKRKLEREHNKPSWLQQVWGRTIDTLTDFVFRPLRTVKWAAGFVLAGAVVFGAADHFGRMVPHQPIVLAKAEYQDARRAGRHPFRAARAAVPDYPGFNPLAFSLDVFVPLFNLHQEPYWAPDAGGNDFARWLTRGAGKFDWWWALTAWYWIEIAAGWLLSSLLLLSVTGLLRPRIGGGD